MVGEQIKNGSFMKRCGKMPLIFACVLNALCDMLLYGWIIVRLIGVCLMCALFVSACQAVHVNEKLMCTNSEFYAQTLPDISVM